MTIKSKIREIKHRIKVLILILKIWEWHDSKFSKWDFEKQRGKFNKEVYEFIQAMESYTSSNNDPTKLRLVFEEMADIIISGLNTLKYHQGYTTLQYKFNIVRRRKYGKDGQHKTK
jgi:NTP pyrophosphatase (non-canonical NTP hydrolase)